MPTAVLLGLLLAACDSGAETTTTTAPVTTTSSTTTTSTTTTTIPSCSAPADTSNPSPSTTRAGDEPEGNDAPSVQVLEPEDLSRHQMVLNDEGTCFEITIEFVAETTDPNGDDYIVEWFSSDEGFLGTGDQTTAVLHTVRSDVAHPVITARATDEWGAVSEAQIQILIWIPSDT